MKKMLMVPILIALTNCAAYAGTTPDAPFSTPEACKATVGGAAKAASLSSKTHYAGFFADASIIGEGPALECTNNVCTLTFDDVPLCRLMGKYGNTDPVGLQYNDFYTKFSNIVEPMLHHAISEYVNGTPFTLAKVPFNGGEAALKAHMWIQCPANNRSVDTANCKYHLTF